MQPSTVNLPALAPHYDEALRLAISYIFANFGPFAIVVSGSIVRGNPDSASDLDLLVLCNRPGRQRVQKWFGGIPAEIFVNSPEWMESYFRQESAEGRPIMANMLATGTVVFSNSEKTEQLIELARASTADGPNFSDAALLRQRYSCACLFEDAFEIADRDPGTASMIVNRAIDAAISYWFSSRQQFSTRPKDQLATIHAESPEIAACLNRALLAAALESRIAAARELAQSVLGHTGFFEWDSGLDSRNP